MIDLDRLPAEIRESHRAVLWNHENRNGKPTKVPYSPRQPDFKAAVDDPATWGGFAEALTAFEDGKADGVGHVLGDGLVGVDIDHCRDPQTGEITVEAQAIIRTLDSYAEISPSGKGIHVWVKGSLPPGGRRKGEIEMYSEGRYFTVTGQHLQGTPTTIEERTAQLAALHARLFGRNGNGRRRPRPKPAGPVSRDDTTLLDRAEGAANGGTFSRLWTGDISGYPSQSEADLALCDHLAFWTGRDAARMDHLFRQSGLMREKWDERRGAQTYGEMTIAKAITDCRETYAGPTAPSRSSPPSPASSPEANATPDTATVTERLTDLGNAKRIVARHGQDLRYCHPWRCWLVWDGRRWVKDDTGEVVRRAKETVRGIYAEASDCGDEEQRKALAKHAARCEADAKIKAMLSVAQSESELVVRPEDFDRDPWLLTVTNGTVDLRTGELGAHRREDLIAKLAPVSYNPAATAPTWEKFLHRIFDGNADLIAFVQRAVGYSLTASTREQAWFLLHGKGANGKTTLLRTLTDLLGDYASWTPTSTLMAKRGEHVENDLAALRSARLVAAVEAEGGKRLAEALIKRLTGGDKVAARFLYSEYFEYVPTFKVWFGTNHRPEVKGTDHAVWRRIRLIPFTVVIPDAEQDRDLPEKLKAEYPGILRWELEGCLAWQQQGLGWAEDVRKATAEYRASQDVIGQFLAERCEADPAESVGATDLYRAYTSWCEQNKEGAESQRTFGDALSERGYQGGRDSVTNRKTRIGLRLVSEQSEQSEPLFGKVQLISSHKGLS